MKADDDIAASLERESAGRMQRSSSLTFARSLFFAAEGQELADQGLAFPSAVAAYYSLFHLGASLLLAYCSTPAAPNDPDSSIRTQLEKRRKRRPRTFAGAERYFPDPAMFIEHAVVPHFLEREQVTPQEIPELGLNPSLNRKPPSVAAFCCAESRHQTLPYPAIASGLDYSNWLRWADPDFIDRQIVAGNATGCDLQAA
jgi:hypothetical protein